MMKWIFGLLILVNLVFFAVMQWGGALTVDNTPSIQTPLNADKIKIVTVLPTSSPVPSSAVVANSSVALAPSVPVAPAPVTVAPPARLSCMEWSEFAGADLKRAEKSLADLKLADRAKERSVEYTGGYWIYIPPLKSPAQIKKKIDQLKKFGVEDYFVMKEAGTWKNAISLGMFKTEDSAKKYLAKLRENGVRSAKIGPRNSKLKYTVFELSRLDSTMTSQITALRKDFPENELKKISCN